jgi:hypothetical protein
VGRLNLTTLVELRDVLADADLVEILNRAAGRTEEEVRGLVAALRPQAAPADLVRKLATQRNHSGGSGPELHPGPAVAAGTHLTPSAELPTPASTSAPTPPSQASPRAPSNQPARLEPIAPERHLLRVMVGPDFVADLQAVRAALSHKLPAGALEDVLHACIRVTLRSIERQRQGAGKKTVAKTPPPGSRYVPVAVRDEVRRRDGGRCGFIGAEGHRCNSRHQLSPASADSEPIALSGHDLDVAAAGRGQRLDVPHIGGEDLVVVLGQEHQGGVDHVGSPGDGQELAGRAPERLIEGPHLYTGQRSGQQALTGSASAPDLPDHAAVGGGNAARQQGCLVTLPHRPIVALESQQRAAVENQLHAARPFRRVPGPGLRCGPRTTRAAF